ncbi:symmetrical bis(5'-nucleosyl)-tetraphosphatase [Buchnera aphidicola]|uniref:symmetrical bis(5'-nucleosyl)-tetraphosphatase n=1 Tax=Buchnera aphidicola TaxID=9 RepID=UPI0031B7FF78
MSTYIIGDIHGCFYQMKYLINNINFNSSKDTLLITGDLVSKGPYSLLVLRYLISLGNKVKIVLGNHDLHFLSVFYKIKKNNFRNNFSDILNAPDLEIIVNWIRTRNIMYIDQKKKIIMTHAGIFPYWDLTSAFLYAKEVENLLSGLNCAYFLKLIQGNYPCCYEKCLTKSDLYRFIVNVFTRMRYINLNKKLSFQYSNSSNFFIDYKLKPWFKLNNMRYLNNYSLFFGHWSALCGKGTPDKIYAMDTGCCWGNYLSMMRFEDNIYFSKKCVF